MDFQNIKSKIDFDSINELRIKNKKIVSERSTIITVISLAVFVLLFILLWSYFSFKTSIGASALVFLILYFGLTIKFVSKYQEEFKNVYIKNVIEIILKSLDIDLKLKPEEKMLKEDFSMGKIVVNYDSFNAEELFEGRIDGIPYKFSEVDVRQRNRNSGYSLLRGFYAIFNFGLDKDFVLDIVKDKDYNLKFLQGLNMFRDKLVSVEHSEFEQKYAVYSNNQELAKKIIDKDFIKNLAKVSKSLGQNLYMTIRKGNVHIAYEDQTNYFVIDFEKKSEALAEKYFEDVDKIYQNMLLIKKFIDDNILKKL